MARARQRTWAHTSLDTLLIGKQTALEPRALEAEAGASLRPLRSNSCLRRASSRLARRAGGIALCGTAGEEDFAAEGMEEAPEAEAPEAARGGRVGERRGRRVGEPKRRRRGGGSLEAEVVSLFTAAA